ncbi:hypothetical protein N431DRAFT_449926 [Stipitochalara longipes BDJ]|nr:hypothetical protein N431DRAFT_449926 [Stipitochalara longipes BDJ]
MDLPQEIQEFAHIPLQAHSQNIPWETPPTAVDSRETVPSVVDKKKVARNSNKYKDKYSRLYDLKDNVSYFIDPEDGAPKEVITQQSIKSATVVITAQPYAQAIGNRWSRDGDPSLREDRQQQTLTTSVGGFNVMWDRCSKMKNKSALAMQLIYWIYADIPPALISSQAANDEESRSPHAPAGRPSGQDSKTWAELRHNDRRKCWRFSWRYLIGTIGLTAMLIWPSSIEESLRNGGYFDPVRYRDWDYPQNARNFQEQEDHNADNTDISERSDGTRNSPTQQEPPPIIGEHSAGPSGTNSSSGPARQDILPGVKRSITPESGDKTSEDFEYAFISYSRRQFFTQSEDNIQDWKRGDAENDKPWSRGAERMLRDQIVIDRQFLTRIALKAITDSRLKAFYIDFECVDSTILEQKGKAAKEMVVVIGPRNQDIFKTAKNPLLAPKSYNEAKKFWLQQWGSRLWTLSELLLAPPGKLIDTYFLPSNPNKESFDATKVLEGKWVEVSSLPYDNNGNLIEVVGKETWTKSTFSSRAYETQEDATDVANLVDHFEGTLALWRRENDTYKFLDGDCSYALMGLLRRRPPVKAEDKDFEAFAQLSLANDSDRLLERVICLLPRERSAPWHDWEDAWPEVRLWDIEPITQVAAIADNSTVVLDGAYGATIHWRKLHPVAFVKRKTAWRQVTKFALRLGALYFIIAIILVAEARPKTTTISNPFGSTTAIHTPANHPLLITGAILLVLTILVLIYAPWAMLKLYRGKFWGTQGWFFGIEGCADIGEVEKCLFGGNHNRLKWSTNGSILSRHGLGRVHNGSVRECLPREPAAARWDRETFGDQRRKRGGIERLYTLIDTYSMEATLFWAEVPPTAIFICGSEGE